MKITNKCSSKNTINLLKYNSSILIQSNLQTTKIFRKEYIRKCKRKSPKGYKVPPTLLQKAFLSLIFITTRSKIGLRQPI